MGPKGHVGSNPPPSVTLLPSNIMLFVRKVLEVIGACVLVVSVFVMCYTPLHSSRIEPTDAARVGFKIAQNCFPSSLKLEEITLNEVKGNDFQILFDATPVVGFGLYRHVFVAEKFKDDTITWAHEFIHSFGVVGHPKNIFNRCNL